MLIVFDLDGTLIDSVADIAASVNELITTLGGQPLDINDVKTMVGDGASILIRRALRQSGVNRATPGVLARFLEIYDRRLLDHTVAYPGIREALPIAARRARLAVLTNKPSAHSERVLDGLDLRSFFDTVIGGDGPLGRKPAPAGLRALMAHAPGPAMLVGDSPIDWKTAQAGGCAFAWARYGFGAARFGETVPPTPYVIERPSDLIGVVDRFSAVNAGA